MDLRNPQILIIILFYLIELIYYENPLGRVLLIWLITQQKTCFGSDQKQGFKVENASEKQDYQSDKSSRQFIDRGPSFSPFLIICVLRDNVIPHIIDEIRQFGAPQMKMDYFDHKCCYLDCFSANS